MSEHDDNDEDFAEATLIPAIENQLESGEPAAAKAVYNKLTLVGYAREEILELMALVLAHEVDAMLREDRPFDGAWYEQALRALGVDPDALPCALVLASNEAILSAVTQGGLLAAVSELAARPLIASGALVAVGPELPPRPFDLVRHPDRRPSRAAAALLDSLSDAL